MREPWYTATPVRMLTVCARTDAYGVGEGRCEGEGRCRVGGGFQVQGSSQVQGDLQVQSGLQMLVIRRLT